MRAVSAESIAHSTMTLIGSSPEDSVGFRGGRERGEGEGGSAEYARAAAERARARAVPNADPQARELARASRKGEATAAGTTRSHDARRDVDAEPHHAPRASTAAMARVVARAL